MKKLVGGDYLLDLTPIEIEQSEDGVTKTNITNKDVIAQLTNLKNYIRNPEMIKPVWVSFNNGETDEKIVARGQLSVVDTGEFEICVSVNGYKLRLFIEFTQAELSDNTPIDDWYIDTNDAKYLFTSDEQNIGAVIKIGNIENAKPIYCHPIAIYDTTNEDSTKHFMFTCLIFNNSPTALNKTAFVEFVQSLPTGARIMLSGGGFNYDPKGRLISSCLYNTNEGIYVEGWRVNDDYDAFLLNLSADTIYLEDGVNKIN